MEDPNIQTKLKTVEEVHIKIDDIVFVYLKEYGPICNWSSITKSIFSLNCDIELTSFLEKNGFVLNKNSIENGITFGLLVIKKEIEEFYYQKYGKTLDIYTKLKMYDNINLASYNYLVTGFEEYNGN